MKEPSIVGYYDSNYYIKSQGPIKVKSRSLELLDTFVVFLSYLQKKTSSIYKSITRKRMHYILNENIFSQSLQMILNMVAMKVAALMVLLVPLTSQFPVEPRLKETGRSLPIVISQYSNVGIANQNVKSKSAATGASTESKFIEPKSLDVTINSNDENVIVFYFYTFIIHFIFTPYYSIYTSYPLHFIFFLLCLRFRIPFSILEERS